MRKHSISQSFWVYRYLFSSQGHENKFVRVLGHEKNLFLHKFDNSIGLHDPNAKERGLQRPLLAYWSPHGLF